MASPGPSAKSIIAEPSTPTHALNPPSLTTASPDLDSSPNSLGSSRPQSQHSSSTSISDRSSDIELAQIPKSVPEDAFRELPPPVSLPAGSPGSSAPQQTTLHPPRSAPLPTAQIDQSIPATQQAGGKDWFPLIRCLKSLNH